MCHLCMWHQVIGRRFNFVRSYPLRQGDDLDGSQREEEDTLVPSSPAAATPPSKRQATPPTGQAPRVSALSMKTLSAVSACSARC
jgi:hypothetical protein